MRDLRPVHTDVDKTLDPGNKAKIIGGTIVVLAVLVLGGYGYSTGLFNGKVVPDSRLPQATLPHNAPNG